VPTFLARSALVALQPSGGTGRWRCALVLPRSMLGPGQDNSKYQVGWLKKKKKVICYILLYFLIAAFEVGVTANKRCVSCFIFEIRCRRGAADVL